MTRRWTEQEEAHLQSVIDRRPHTAKPPKDWVDKDFENYAAWLREVDALKKKKHLLTDIEVLRFTVEIEERLEKTRRVLCYA